MVKHNNIDNNSHNIDTIMCIYIYGINKDEIRTDQMIQDSAIQCSTIENIVVLQYHAINCMKTM